MATTEPFVWGAGGAKLSATDVARNRKVAEALASRMQNPQNFWEGMQSLTGDVGAALLNWQADEAEEKGRSAVAEALLAAQGGEDPSGYIAVLGNEFASPAQSAVAQALLQRQWSAADRQAGWDREDRIRAEEAARPDWKTFEAGGDVYRWNQNDPDATPGLFFDGPDAPKEAPKTDTIYDPETGREQKVEWDAQARNWKPIGGVKAAPEKEGDADARAALAAGRRDTATDTITSAAARARELAENPGNVGISGAAWGFLSDTQAAELRRQVDVLRSTASIENLTAMRQASPTGGALGSVTERENAMLASASGAINPDSSPEDFRRQLDNYERTLLRIVHGPAEGDRIFEATRGKSNDEAPKPGHVEDGYRFKGGDPANPDNWEKV